MRRQEYDKIAKKMRLMQEAGEDALKAFRKKKTTKLVLGKQKKQKGGATTEEEDSEIDP